MTAVPEAPAPPGQKRVATDLPGDVARRLRTWAALLDQPVSHVIAALIVPAVPTDGELAALISRHGGGGGSLTASADELAAQMKGTQTNEH